DHSRDSGSKCLQHNQTERVSLRRKSQNVEICERPRQVRSCQHARELRLLHLAAQPLPFRPFSDYDEMKIPVSLVEQRPLQTGQGADILLRRSEEHTSELQSPMYL